MLPRPRRRRGDIELDPPRLPPIKCWIVIEEDGSVTCRRGNQCEGFCRKIYAYSCGGIVDVGCSCTQSKPARIAIVAD